MNVFKELARKNKKISDAECIALLETETRGVLSVNGSGGYPYGMPMNHYYSSADGCIYFHCGRYGHRLEALEKDPMVSFCVTEHGIREDGDWAYTVRSVIVFGKVEIISDAKIVADIGKVHVEIPTYHFNIIKNSKACDNPYKSERAVNRLKY